MISGGGDVFDAAACALLVVGNDGRVRRANQAAVDLAGRDHADDLRGLSVNGLFPTPPGSPSVADLASDAAGSGRPASAELAAQTGTAGSVVLAWTAAPTADGVVLSATDVTDRHAVTAELHHRALHDPLTDLPNRTLLLERLEHALTRLQRNGGELAVIFLDLDRFKAVNDSLGHDAGDRLLVGLAERLRTVLRPSDTVARFAGDEFVVICEDVGNGPSVVDIADRLIAAIEQPFWLDGTEVTVSASVGVAMARHSGTDPQALLRDADAAMYRAKDRGRRTRGPAPLPRPSGLGENDLRGALERGEVSISFQPEVSLTDGRLVGVEALARWNHAELGPVRPAAFLGVAEATGLVVELGHQVLAAAARQAAEWAAQAKVDARMPPVVSVNLSLRELEDAGIEAAVAAAIREAGAPPELLRLEIAERTLVRAGTPVLDTLRRLRDLGVGLAVDDAGRSLATIRPLHDLRLKEIKLDRPWVRSLGRESVVGRGTVDDVRRLAESLGAVAVAEGVETEAELEAVTASGYTAAAGHWFAAPQPATVIDRLLATGVRWRTA